MEIAQEQQIKAMPTFIVYKGGKMVESFTGAVPAKLNVSITCMGVGCTSMLTNRNLCRRFDHLSSLVVRYYPFNACVMLLTARLSIAAPVLTLEYAGHARADRRICVEYSVHQMHIQCTIQRLAM